MRATTKLLCVSLMVFLCSSASSSERAAEGLKVLGGLAVRLPLQEIAKLYERETGARVEVVIGPPATLVAQMAKERSGDVFIPGSRYGLGLAREKGLVGRSAGETIAYLVPCIAVPAGNPKGIHSLRDLTRPGVRVGVRSDAEGPEKPCLDDVAKAAFAAAGVARQVEANIAARLDKCEQTAAAIREGRVDAVVTWSFFAARFPKEIEAVSFPEARANYRAIPAAPTTCAADPEAARRFLEFLVSPQGQAAFARYGYAPRMSKPPHARG